MKIALVQYRPAIRLYKWATVMKKLGHRVTIIHTHDPVPDLRWHRFGWKRFLTCKPNDYDYWISFNANNAMSHPEGIAIPVIQAVGDLSGVYGKYEKTERETLRKSTKNVFVSLEQMKWAEDNYQISGSVIYNKVLHKMIGKPKPKTGGIVYAGTLSGAPNHNRNIIAQLEQYEKVHIYPSSLGLPAGYTGNNLVIHKIVKPYDLVSELSQYATGLILMQNPAIANMAVPNKLFEYIAAGLDVQGTLSPEACQIIDNDILITFESQIDEISKIAKL